MSPVPLFSSSSRTFEAVRAVLKLCFMKIATGHRDVVPQLLQLFERSRILSDYRLISKMPFLEQKQVFKKFLPSWWTTISLIY